MVCSAEEIEVRLAVQAVATRRANLVFFGKVLLHVIQFVIVRDLGQSSSSSLRLGVSYTTFQGYVR